MKAFVFFKKAIFLFALFIQVLFFYFNPNRFEIWDQINSGISNFDSIITFEYFDSHSIRIIVIYTVIFVGELFSYSPVFSFNIFLNLLLLGNVYLIQKIFSSFRFNIFEFIIVSFLPLLICQFQNGRGIITSFAFLLLYYSLSRYTRYSKDFLNFLYTFILSLTLLNVSSGSFMVGIIATFAYLYRFRSLGNSHINKINKFSLFFLISSFILISPLVIVYLSKNLEFYDGSMINMLSHGIWSILSSLNYILLLFSILIIIPVLLFIKTAFSAFKELNSFQPFLIAGFVGLLFGFTAFFTGIYLYIIFAFILFNNLSLKKNKLSI